VDVGRDADGDAFDYTYSWSVGGDTHTGQVLAAGTAARGDVVTCTATPDDGFDTGTPVTSPPLTVGNAPPTAATPVITPDPATSSDTLSCASDDLQDPDGDEVSATYTWSITPTGGPSRLFGPSDTLPAAEIARGDRVTCTATPNDGTEDGTPRTSAQITIGNSAPAYASVDLTPTDATVQSTMSCTPQGYADADADPASPATIRWIVDDMDDGPQLEPTDIRKGKRIRCAATPYDGFALGEEVLSNEVTIADTPGTVEGTTITPAQPTSADVLQCVAGTFVDPDPEDTSVGFSFRWLDADDGLITTGNALTPAHHARGDQVRCEATANGTDVTGRSALVTIANSPPEVVALGIDPGNASAVDDLTALPDDVQDADADTLTFTWSWALDDGTPLGTGETLTAGGYAKGDVVVLTGTADDGNGGTDTGTAQITIGNAKPDPVTPVWSTQTPVRHADDLVCGLPPGAPATDIDGDSVTYRVQWSDNGTTWVDAPSTPNPNQYATTALLSDTLLRDWPTPGTRTYCRLIATDGDRSQAGPGIQVDWTDGPWVFVVDTTDDAPQANPGSFNTTCADALGRCSLRAAIMAAGSINTTIDPLGSEIHLAPGATYETTLPAGTADVINPQYGTLDIAKPFALIGDEAQPPRIVPTEGGLWITSSTYDPGWGVRFEHVDFENAPGRAIFVDDAVGLSMDGVTMTDCGYPLQVNGSEVDLTDVTITGDAGTGDAAILLNQGVSGTLTRLTITGRGDTQDPGGFSALSLINPGTVTLSTPLFEDNAANRGGHINLSASVSTATLIIDNGQLSGGVADGAGGSIEVPNDGVLTLIDTTIEGSIADSGGAIYSGNSNYTPVITLDGTTVRECEARFGAGGGLYLDTAQLVLDGATVQDNDVLGLGTAATGGGLFLRDVIVVAQDAVVTGNTVAVAGQGGGVWHEGATVLPAGLSVSGNVPEDVVDGDGP